MVISYYNIVIKFNSMKGFTDDLFYVIILPIIIIKMTKNKRLAFMDKIFSNQATPKYLGYVYQVLIAIESYFNAKKNQTIWLECYGDIYDGTTIIETKSHLEHHDLTSNSVDFWKTLYNFLKENTDTVEYFILHTTSDVPIESIFYNWNDKNVKEKYEILKSHSPVSTIQKYYDFIFSDKLKVKLNSVLERFSIKSSQESVENKWNNLIKDGRLIHHFCKSKEDALHWLYGQFNKQAIIEHKKWCIDVNDMDEKLTLFSKVFKREKIPFPFVSQNEIHFDIKECKFKFINELEKIKLKKMAILTAVSDYLRAQNSHIQLINKYADTLSNILENHNETILDRLRNKKQKHAENIQEKNINSEELLYFSRQLYHDCVGNTEKIDIPNVSDTGMYYQNGRIHHNVDEEKFSWVFNDEDIT
ncbi:hypothetical protein [Gilliamella sp. ESL0250]|uniref:hypothetical protein n=1 Tax=Gilliamella sp. ESL0250 TaxID=2705036 RepID=UPI001580E9B3|nr:hypothetical protein [Gilliamella sp. ESL0250]NUF48956.1 hypothetical protein [Gilliamella sp. ESL0250]